MAETKIARNSTAWFGWVTFAAVIMCVLGLLNVLEGLVTLLRSPVTFIDGSSLVVVDLTWLGVGMVVFGGLLVAAGIGLLARNTVARIAAIVIVSLHLLSQVASLGAFPVWSLLMITVDVVVLFALTVHWSDVPGGAETQLPPGGIHRADRDVQQSRGGFPMNVPPTGADRGTPMPGTPGGGPTVPTVSPTNNPAANPAESPGGGPAHATQDRPAPPAYQQPQGPYPPGRPGSPTHHAAPTSGYGTGAI